MTSELRDVGRAETRSIERLAAVGILVCVTCHGQRAARCRSGVGEEGGYRGNTRVYLFPVAISLFISVLFLQKVERTFLSFSHLFILLFFVLEGAKDFLLS